MPKYDWVYEQVYVTPSTHRIFTKDPKVIDEKEVFVALVGSSGTIWVSENMELRATSADLYEVEVPTC